MFKKLYYISMFAALFLVTGCAEGTSMYETPGAMNSPSQGMARIVVYRPAEMMGAGVQPVIRVGELETGRCTPNGVFLVSVPPGEYFVTATTEVSSSVLIDLNAGDTAYVKCGIGVGFFIGQPKLTIVEANIGRGESASLALTGTF